MRSYQDSERGTFQNEEFANRKVSFDGMLFPGRYGVRTVTPTDIDGYIQLDRLNAFIFFELKYGRGDVPAGQLDALKKLVDAVDNKERGNNSVLFVATHQTATNSGPIIAKDAIVIASYWNGKWRNLKPSSEITLLYAINSYIKLCEEEQNMGEWE